MPALSRPRVSLLLGIRAQRYHRNALIVPVAGLIATIAFPLKPGLGKDNPIAAVERLPLMQMHLGCPCLRGHHRDSPQYGKPYHSNQDPRCTQKPIYTPVCAHHIRS